MILRDVDIAIFRPVEPFHERTIVNGLSYGLSACGYDIRVEQELDLAPGQFTLASSIERFRMPNNLVAFPHDKSTWARRGLAVQNTVIEPGWEGYLTLELTNHGRDRLHIQAGDPIAQIIFHQLSGDVGRAYNGKYQNQPAVPVPAKMELLVNKS